MTVHEDGRNDRSRLATRLVDVVGRLGRELQPKHSAVTVTLETNLDRELGFDSLSRIELISRIEQEIDVRLPESVLASAETVADLLAAVLDAGAASPRDRAGIAPEPILPGAAATVPARIATLTEVLDWHVDAHGERPHLQIYELDASRPVTISYAELRAGAERVGAGLVEHGLVPGDAVAIMLPTGRDLVETFFGVLLAGGVPVPIYPPARPSQLEDHLRRHARIVANANARLLVTFAQAGAAARLLRSMVECLQAVVTPADLTGAAHALVAPRIGADDVALLQYTSGSTGQPKGVVLTHAQLLANIRAMGRAIEATPRDAFVSWLPMYHDMGLVGAWLGSLYFAVLAVIMPPTAFLARPVRWLEAIHRHRATLSSAPNFAYELCLSKISDGDLVGLDLSSWRVAFNGAEPVSPATLRRFADRFGRYGFDPRAQTPVYGLAEVGVGLSFPPLGRGPLIDRVKREPFERTGHAEPATADDSSAIEVVACGRPLSGYEIRIVDASGRELGERIEGRLEFRGPSATRGYVRNPEANHKLFDGDWLDSGDLAYVAAGDVYLTGRIKDVIIRAGRNVYPYELEEAVGALPGVRKGCVAVFGSTTAAGDVERLIVVAETRSSQEPPPDALRARIESVAADVLGVSPDDVLLVPPHTVLKTSSGKIRRAACRELYEAHRLGHAQRSTRAQVARLWLAGLAPRLRRGRRAAADAAYAGYARLLFVALLPAALLPLALLPRLTWRWRSTAACARALLRLARVPLTVENAARVPAAEPCLLASNHASYLDGLVLVAALPAPAAFVAKAELLRKPFARWFLRRIGARFVERLDPEAAVADARKLASSARGSVPLLFFPEGTFTRSPGVLPFHMGAFVAAAQHGLPVVPIAIRGTRSILRGDVWYPRRGAIAVVFGTPIAPRGTDWQAALELRDAVRAHVLAHAGEPDLGDRERPPLG